VTERVRVVSEGERVEALKLLGLPRSAPPALIRKRYRAAARECHPDYFPDDWEKAERFRQVAAAYEILTKYPVPSLGNSPTGPVRPREGSGFDGEWWEKFGHLV
jgi:hypothetical protein